ncbi:TraM recognition domain-containing protein [Paraburkholderia sp. JPY303]|nr:TraM recognition domain-containing protein [Paraburkholderia atlantica]
MDPLSEKLAGIGQHIEAGIGALLYQKLGMWAGNQLIQLIPAWALGFAIGFSLFGWLTGRRMRRFNKPERPHLSPVIRHASRPVAWLSGTVCAASVLWLFAVFVGIVGGWLLLREANQLDLSGAFAKGWNQFWFYFASRAWWSAGGSVVGGGAGALLALRVIPGWERGEGLADVEKLVRDFKKLNGYDPRPFFTVTRGCFIGKTIRGEPIYVPWAKIRETHIQVMGSTGAGKGVWLSMVAYQCVLAGEPLVWLDPKSDRYSPRLMRAAAAEAGRPFVFLNLNADQPPQLNLLAGASANELADLLVAGFDLRGKGTDGDFHRGRDEDAAHEAADIAAALTDCSLPALMRACAQVDSITGQENFWRSMRKLARLPVFQTAAGVDLADAVLRRHAVVYVVGSTDSEPVRMAQKMVLVRLMQIIKRRARSQRNAPIAVVLDEFKHLLSPAALTGLGAVRDFDAHFFLAHQSISDLAGCPGITAQEAYGAVIDNTAIKVVYRIGDADYAGKLALSSGKRPTYTDSVAKGVNDAGRADGHWREASVPLIDADRIMHLPMPSDRAGQASVGVLFGVGNAKLFHLGPVPVQGILPAPEAAPATADAGAHNAAELI